MHALQRITTSYIPTEDRIRVSGETPDGQTVVIWLSLRLAQRMVPVLARWLEGQAPLPPEQFASNSEAQQAARVEMVQSFVQEAARAELKPQKPVSAAAPLEQWMARTLNVERSGQEIALILRSGEGEGDAQAARLTMPAKVLRQWLGMLMEAYRKGDWPLDKWPSWLQGGAAAGVTGAAGGGVLH
ncbi:MAG: hypothetical protein V4582_13750 [Pseudomonadota bacterium]